jgi:hypothetical protein
MDESAIETQERQRKRKALDEASSALMSEHGFDSVVILATYRPENGGTVGMKSDRGNWFAQNGQMAHVLGMRSEESREDARAEMRDREQGND